MSESKELGKDVWLRITRSGDPERPHTLNLGVEALTNKPSLKRGQIAVQLSVAVPSTIFDLPVMRARLQVNASNAVLPDVEIETLDGPGRDG
ncbi:MAG: hypothetical protein AAFR96_13390 [Planctomycetota bacterium]